MQIYNFHALNFNKKVSNEVQFGRFQVDWSLKKEASKCMGRKMTIGTKNSDTKIRIMDNS